jgi:hypothetical protein
MTDLSLPPSVTVSPTTIGVSVLTDDGAVVLVSLPRQKGLREVPTDEMVGRARGLARQAMMTAAEALGR